MNERPDPYSWWLNATERGIIGPIHESTPQPGFYRRRVKGGTWEGIAIWTQGGVPCATMGRAGSGLKPCDAIEAWTWGSKNPISEAMFRSWETKGRFSDDVAPPAKGSVPGDNVDGDTTAFDAMRTDVLDVAEQATMFFAKDAKGHPVLNQPLIGDKETADRAAVLARRAGELAKKADDARDDEQRPHLEATRTVNDKWRDTIVLAKSTAALVKGALQPFLQKQRDEEAARQAAARKAADEAAAALAAAAAKPDAEPANVVQLEEKLAEAVSAAKPKKNGAGRTGAKVSLRKETVAKVVDYELALAFFKNRPEVRELIEKLANQVIAAKGTVPGVIAVTVDKPV